MRTARLSCFTLLTHWIDWALFLALASAGNSIAAKIGIISKKIADAQMPPMANPSPPNFPWLFLILINDTIPQISPINEVIPHVNNPAMPSTSELIARPLVFLVGAVGKGAGTGWPDSSGGRTPAAGAAENSANAE